MDRTTPTTTVLWCASDENANTFSAVLLPTGFQLSGSNGDSLVSNPLSPVDMGLVDDDEMFESDTVGT